MEHEELMTETHHSSLYLQLSSTSSFLPASYKASNFSFYKCFHFSSENPSEMLIFQGLAAQAVLPKHPHFPFTAAEKGQGGTLKNLLHSWGQKL